MKQPLNLNEVKELLLVKQLKLKDAAKILSVPVIRLQRFMRKENIRIAKRYSIETITNIKQLLNQKCTHTQIAKNLNMTTHQVKYIIHKYLQTKKVPKVYYSNHIGIDLSLEENQNIFWYLVGLITTDGHIRKECSSIIIFQNDYTFLKSISNLLKHNGKIYNTQKDKKMYSITISDDYLYDFLIQNNFKSDKRYTVQMCNCPKEYLNDYLRGIFDGDGCICYRYISGRFEGNIIQITTGSSLFAEQLKNTLVELKFNVNVNKSKSKANNFFYNIQICQRQDVLNFCKFIYENDPILKLNKKYIKYIKFIKLLEWEKQVNDIVEAI